MFHILKKMHFANISLIAQILKGLLALFGVNDELLHGEDVILCCCGEIGEVQLLCKEIFQWDDHVVFQKMNGEVEELLKAQFDTQHSIALGSSSQPQQPHILEQNMIILGPIPNMNGAFSCDLGDFVSFKASEKPGDDLDGYGLIMDVKDGRVSVRFGAAICNCTEGHILEHYRVFKV
jgi:hypothetical protein